MVGGRGTIAVLILGACSCGTTGGPQQESPAPQACPSLQLKEHPLQIAPLGQAVPVIGRWELAVGETQALLSTELYDVETSACRSVRIDAAGRPLGPQLDDLGCGPLERAFAVGDDFLVAPDTPATPLKLVRADGRVETVGLGEFPVPCPSCVAGAWWSDDTIILLGKGAGETSLFRYRLGSEGPTRTQLLGSDHRGSWDFRSTVSHDTRGAILLGSGSPSSRGVWVQLLDRHGDPRGAPSTQHVRDLVWEVGPAVRDEVHAFVEWTEFSSARLVFASTATTALTVGPWTEFDTRPEALATTRSGFVLRSLVEVVEFDAGGVLVARTPVSNHPSIGRAGPAGLIESRPAEPERDRILVGDHVAFEAPPLPRSITAARIAGGPHGALIAWTETASRSQGLGLVRVNPSGEAASPVLVPDTKHLSWMAATESGYLLGLNGDLLRVHLDGTTELVPNAGFARGAVAVVGGRVFAVDADNALVELGSNETSKRPLEGLVPRLLTPDVTGQWTLISSVTLARGTTALHLRLFDGTNLIGAPITIEDFGGMEPQSWTCGAGCWELASPATNERWRVVLEANGLRVTPLQAPTSRFVDAAADTCHRAQVEHEHNPDEYVLTSPGPPQVLPGDRYSVARVGPDRFWIVAWRLAGRLSVLSLEP